MRVLIVEDDPIAAVDMQDALRELGHEQVRWGLELEPALREAEENRPDLIIVSYAATDFAAPSEAVRALTERLRAPVVVICEGGEREKAACCRPVACLPRPVTAAALESAIATAMR
jgi:AmiR/NasT family two-component response regulator